VHFFDDQPDDGVLVVGDLGVDLEDLFDAYVVPTRPTLLQIGNEPRDECRALAASLVGGRAAHDGLRHVVEDGIHDPFRTPGRRSMMRWGAGAALAGFLAFRRDRKQDFELSTGIAAGSSVNPGKEYRDSTFSPPI